MGDASLGSPIGPHELHIWRFRLDPPEASIGDLVICLSQDERERAARFRFAVHRRRWRVAHIAVRQILAGYAGVPAAELRFQVGARGKPALLPPHDGIHFNLTHTHDLGLLCIASAPSGIDAEHIDRRTEIEALVRRVASDEEREAFRRCPAAARRAAFFRLWTRKEAYTKGRGLGHGLPLRANTVPVMPLAGPADIRVEADWDDGKRWRLRELDAPPGYAASLAYAGMIDRLCLEEWRPADQAAEALGSGGVACASSSSSCKSLVRPGTA